MTALSTAAERVARWAGTEHRLVAASIIRVGLGLVALSFYLLHYPYRHFFWGPDAFLSFESFAKWNAESGSFSLYRLSDSPVAFELIFHAGILVTGLWVLGLWTRLTGVATYVFTFSIWERNGFLLDGGDNVLVIVMFYLMFVRTDAYLSVGRLLRGEAAAPAGPARERWWAPIPAVLHNAGMTAIILQLCVVYLTAGLTKVQGAMWQSGVALYYILRVDEFTLPGVAEYVYRNMWVVVAATYMTVFEQIAYPFMLLNKWAKRLSVFIVVQMHLGIGVIMGLVSFSVVMITLQVSAFSDGELLAAARWARALSDAAWERGRRLVRTLARREEPVPVPVVTQRSAL